MSGVRQPRLLRFERESGGTFREQARLRPVKYSAALEAVPMSKASMTLPEGAPDVKMHDLIEVFTLNGSAGIFRVTGIRKNYRKETEIELNHAVDILNDTVYPGNPAGDEEFDGTVGAFLAECMTAQSRKLDGVNYWQLGTVEDTGHWHKKIAYANLYELVTEVGKKHENFMFTFDFSTWPWTMNFVARDRAVLSEFRLKRNMESCEVNLDDSELCTRLYLSVTGDSQVTENGRPAGKRSGQTYYTFNDTDAQAVWGIVEKSAGIKTSEDPDTSAWVADYFERHNSPAVQIEISGAELYSLTGVSIDEMHLGRICRVALPEYAAVFNERIITVEYPDLIRTPMKVNVSLANKRLTAEDAIAAVKKEATGGGGGAAKAQEDVDNLATEVERQKIIYELHVEQSDEKFEIIATEQEWVDAKEEYQTTHETKFHQDARQFALVATEAEWAAQGAIAELAKKDPQAEYNEAHARVIAEGGTIEEAEAAGEAALQACLDAKTKATFEQKYQTQLTVTAQGLQSTVSAVDGRVSEIKQTVDGITLSGNTITIRGTSVDVLQPSQVSISGDVITIKGNHIDMGDYVTVANLQANYATITDLDAAEAAIRNLETGVTTASLLRAASIISTGQVTCNTLSVGGALWASRTMTMSGIGGTLTTFLGTGDVNLGHYHAISCSESGGVVTITQGAAQSTPGSDSFNIAATQFYQDAVAAAEASGWALARGKVVPPAAGTGTSFSVSVPDSTYDTQDTYTFTIQKGATPSSTGYASVAVAGTVVGRIAIGDWYDAGVADGEGKFQQATVTLQGSRVLVNTRGSSVSVTPISGSALKLRYYGNTQLYYKDGSGNYQPAGDSRSWYYVHSTGTNYYQAGTATDYYQGSTAYYYVAGSTDSTHYYTKST